MPDFQLQSITVVLILTIQYYRIRLILLVAFLPSGETLVPSGRTVFDIGAGFVIISGNIYGGFSINHLAEPDLSGDGSIHRGG